VSALSPVSGEWCDVSPSIAFAYDRRHGWEGIPFKSISLSRFLSSHCLCCFSSYPRLYHNHHHQCQTQRPAQLLDKRRRESRVILVDEAPPRDPTQTHADADHGDYDDPHSLVLTSLPPKQQGFGQNLVSWRFPFRDDAVPPSSPPPTSSPIRQPHEILAASVASTLLLPLLVTAASTLAIHRHFVVWFAQRRVGASEAAKRTHRGPSLSLSLPSLPLGYPSLPLTFHRLYIIFCQTDLHRRPLIFQTPPC